MQELLALLMFVLAQFGVGADSTRYIDRLFDGGTVRPSPACELDGATRSKQWRPAPCVQSTGPYSPASPVIAVSVSNVAHNR